MRALRQEVAHFRLPERAMRSAIGLLTLPATPIESSDLFTEAVELVTMHEQPVGGPATHTRETGWSGAMSSAPFAFNCGDPRQPEGALAALVSRPSRWP